MAFWGYHRGQEPLFPVACYRLPLTRIAGFAIVFLIEGMDLFCSLKVWMSASGAAVRGRFRLLHPASFETVSVLQNEDIGSHLLPPCSSMNFSLCTNMPTEPQHGS